MKKSMLKIDGVRILSKNELQSISGAHYSSCQSDADCPMYSSCDCAERCISWTNEDYGDGLCN
ncbi:hypothetical protein [uncultured Dokdonia sp.]|uniref:hypothetical protein n=1 Tax=uncultured Dokdonia sp. TaxID=575653 RepID=UPI00260E8901|nr:hypothetical protein [uncultured Dokdonia sp.]